MKIAKDSLVAAIIIGLLSGIATSAIAQDSNAKDKASKRGFSVEQRADTLAKELKLTDEQKTKVTALLDEQAKKMRELRSEGASQEQRREKMQAMREDHQKKMKEILTADQYEKWQKMNSDMRKKAGQGAPRNKKTDKE